MDNDKNEIINSVLNADISFDEKNDIIDLDKYKKISIDTKYVLLSRMCQIIYLHFLGRSFYVQISCFAF